jgi:primosomal replication protein N
MNRWTLDATLEQRGAMRYTPAGIPALDLSLKHESEATESGQLRKVFVEIRAVALGELTHRLSVMEIGTACGFAGFIGSQRNGRGVLFHVTEIA